MARCFVWPFVFDKDASFRGTKSLALSGCVEIKKRLILTPSCRTRSGIQTFMHQKTHWIALRFTTCLDQVQNDEKPNIVFL